MDQAKKIGYQIGQKAIKQGADGITVPELMQEASTLGINPTDWHAMADVSKGVCQAFDDHDALPWYKRLKFF